MCSIWFDYVRQVVTYYRKCISLMAELLRERLRMFSGEIPRQKKNKFLFTFTMMRFPRKITPSFNESNMSHLLMPARKANTYKTGGRMAKEEEWFEEQVGKWTDKTCGNIDTRYSTIKPNLNSMKMSILMKQYSNVVEVL